MYVLIDLKALFLSKNKCKIVQFLFLNFVNEMQKKNLCPLCVVHGLLVKKCLFTHIHLTYKTIQEQQQR